jgi:hypothetical protein
MDEMPPIEGDPFALARSSCLHAVQVARDVSIDGVALQRFAAQLKVGPGAGHALPGDPVALQRFAAQLNVGAVQDVMRGHMGENCDTVPDEFRHVRDAVNFALCFSLLQFGHGFRYELHRLCGRGASQTITLGVRALRSTDDLCAARLRSITATEIQQVFRLPQDPTLEELARQLLTVLH